MENWGRGRWGRGPGRPEREEGGGEGEARGACCAGALGGYPRESAGGGSGGAPRAAEAKERPAERRRGEEGEGEPEGAADWTGAASPSPKSESP